MKAPWFPGFFKSWFEKREGRSKTPFDHLNGPDGPRMDELDGPEGQLDAFISYKSKHSRAARCVADYLLAAGQNVWFDDYVLLLRGREQWERAIRHGLRTTRWAAAFISDAYADSDPCQMEMRQLLENCGPKNILVVKMDDGTATERRFPEITACPTWRSSEDLADLITFIAEGHPSLELGRREIPCPQPEAVYKGKKLDYSLDLSGWSLLYPEGDWRGEAGPDGMKSVSLIGSRFTANLGGRTANGNLIIGPIRGLDRKTAAIEGGDDREYQNQLIQYVDEYLRPRGYRCAGVHTFRSGAETNSGFTYFANDCWIRKVTIDIGDAYGNGMEFVFTFSFFGPFREYCKYTPYMDGVVESLRWTGAGTARWEVFLDTTRRETF